MLLWAGFLSILIGVAALMIDRALAHFIYDHVNARAHKALDRERRTMIPVAVDRVKRSATNP